MKTLKQMKSFKFQSLYKMASQDLPGTIMQQSLYLENADKEMIYLFRTLTAARPTVSTQTAAF